MSLPRRGRRGRPPFRSSRWQQRTLQTLRLYLAPSVRATMTAWMKIYGETNGLPGLATGPIDVRFRRLREHAGIDTLLLWTTPERWAAGEGLSLWVPAIGLDLDCRFDNGRLWVDRAKPTTGEERDPRRVRAAVGMELRPEQIELPQPDQIQESNGMASVEGSFERLVGRRWSGFVGPLREALEAEAKDDLDRAERLATEYAKATPRIGGQSESDPYRLAGVEASACAAFDEGEWLDLLDTRGRVISSARLVRSDPAEGVLDVDVRGADPPSSGVVRPRPQTQIFAQKRAILEELDNPTGSLREVVRLVASPATLPPPMKRRPTTFVNRLVGRNRSQVRAVSLALGLEQGQALMIQGPPGTGKSTTTAEIIGQLVLRDPNATILVCSHSNHGVDNLLLKTKPYLEPVPDLQVARVGLYDRVHAEARAHFVPPSEDLGAYNVVFTTVDALALQAEAGARTYDYAVLDEANRATILDSLIPLVRGRRFILVGDHLQLQPVLSDAEEQIRLEAAGPRASAIGKSLFAWLRERRFPEAATVFLDEQNRMHPIIAGLISEVFYEGRLRSGPRAPRRVAGAPLFPAAVTWVDTRGLHGLREARGRGASLMNVPEARLVATIARHMLATAPPDLDVGVIAAYAEQTALLRRILRDSGSSPKPQTSNPKPLEIDTVDAFEGREKDIVIVSLVRSNRRRDIGFLRLMQRINVALSRARRLLVVVGDASTLRGSYFDRIIRYTRANGMIVPGPRLIGRLLNARTGARAPVPTRGRRSLSRMGPLRSDLFPPRSIEGRPLDGRPRDNRLSGPVPPDADRAGRRRRRGRRRPDRDARAPTSPQMSPRIVPELPLQGRYRAPVGDEPEPMSGIPDASPRGGGSPSEPGADDASVSPVIAPEHGSVNGTTPTPESPAPRRRTRTRRPSVGETAAAAPAAEVVAPAPEVVAPAAEAAVPVGEVAVPSGGSGDVPAARPTRRRRTAVPATVPESPPVDVGAPERPPADAAAPARSRRPRRVAQVDEPALLPSPASSLPPASPAADDVPVRRTRTARRARPTEGVAEAQDGPSTTEPEPIAPRPRRTRRATREAPAAEAPAAEAPAE